eukprot:580282-Alexandrium_andersonii.AAC.1
MGYTRRAPYLSDKQHTFVMIETSSGRATAPLERPLALEAPTGGVRGVRSPPGNAPGTWFSHHMKVPLCECALSTRDCA